MPNTIEGSKVTTIAQVCQTTEINLNSVRQWFDAIKVDNPKLARLSCKLIPTCCPFERNIRVLGGTFHIPPLCKFVRHIL